MSIKYSEMDQDEWVIGALDGKRDGFFVDIGCAVPFLWNNTAKLEKEYNWQGIAVDLNPYDHEYRINSEAMGYSYNWDERPRTKVIKHDALNLDYKKVFSDYNMPNVIDYLSIDIEPPENNLKVFKLLPHELYKFKTITFEHDDYRMYNGWRKKTIAAITSFGYKHIRQSVQDDYYVYNGI